MVDPEVETTIETAPPRRLVFVDSAFPAISQTFIVNQFLQMLERGWDVQMLTLKRAGGDLNFFPQIRDNPDLMERIHVATNLDQAIANLKPDLVHFEFGNYAVGHLAPLRRRGIRSVVSFRGFDIANWELGQPRFYDEIWQHADAIHCVSYGIWNRCVRRGCPPDFNKTIIYAGVDPSIFDSTARPAPVITGTPQRPFHILCVGRLHWKKGQEFAIWALPRLLEMGVTADLTLIGQGDHENALRFAAAEAGVLDRVYFLGSKTHDQVRSAMLHADALVIPSLSEGFGNVGLEAQAMQLPVVGSDIDGIPENVLDGVTGFVVPPRNPQQMAERLAELALNPELRRSMGAAGRQRVLDNFTIDRQIDQFEQLYIETIHRRYAARRLMGATQIRRPAREPDAQLREQLDAELMQRARAMSV